MSITVKSILMPAKRAQTWPAIVAFLFACPMLGQPGSTAHAEAARRVLYEHGFSSTAGIFVSNRQATVWEAYGPYVAVVMVLLFAQTLLIVELLRQRKKERVVRRHLRESEARFREAESIAQCGSWVWEVSKNKTHWSDQMYRVLGLVPQSAPPNASLIHPEDDQYYVGKLKEASDTHQLYSAELCTCTNIPAQLDNDIALTLLRVVQESLHNIAKHSNAGNVEVNVTGAPGNLTLIVRDNGIGFNIHQSKAAAGLGLISMRERVHLIGGEFTIDSALGTGTRIWARVPW